MESYSNLLPLRYRTSVAYKTRTRGVSVYGYSLALARKPRKLRDEITATPIDVLLFNINELSGGGCELLRTCLCLFVAGNREFTGNSADFGRLDALRPTQSPQFINGLLRQFPGSGYREFVSADQGMDFP